MMPIASKIDCLVILVEADLAAMLRVFAVLVPAKVRVPSIDRGDRLSAWPRIIKDRLNNWRRALNRLRAGHLLMDHVSSDKRDAYKSDHGG